MVAIKQVPVGKDLQVPPCGPPGPARRPPAHPPAAQEIIKEINVLQQCDNENVVRYYGSYFKGGDLWVPPSPSPRAPRAPSSSAAGSDYHGVLLGGFRI